MRGNQDQSAREEKNNGPIQQNLLEEHEDDNDSAPRYIPDSIDSPPRRSIRVLVPRELLSGEITYWSSPLPKADSQDKEGLSGHDQTSPNYVSMRAAKSRQYMVRVLCILSSNIDNEGPDELASLKEDMGRHDWLEWEKAIEIEYNSFMENGTWEIVSPSKKANVITGKWDFKLKKDRFGNILKYKAR